ncbi:Protein containing glutaredoxin domain and PD1-like DNA-binding domain [Synechococcus sp. CC9311]|nr:Protein containing glutaredoxin domain and PD1-like DNA-binding domain [Synechococcus sp. CC9311]
MFLLQKGSPTRRMDTLTLHLEPGQDLLLSLSEVAKEKRVSGFLLGVVGNLSKASFQCPGRDKPTVLEGELEIITLNGTFDVDGVHLHLSLSDGACQVWGGHLETGSLVLKGTDLLLGILKQGQEARSQSETRLEIAVLPGCPWCDSALRLLDAYNIPNKVITVDNDNTFQQCKQRSGMNTFPQVFIDGATVGGFDSLEKLQRSGELLTLK